eukprot:SAG11_NODE_13387_length_657_cov_6.507168_1_plen_96_part_01
MDCASGRCTNGVCVSCFNDITDGSESGVDCGGPTCAQRCSIGGAAPGLLPIEVALSADAPPNLRAPLLLALAGRGGGARGGGGARARRRRRRPSGS